MLLREEGTTDATIVMDVVGDKIVTRIERESPVETGE